MNRRQLLSGAACLLGAGQAHAFGLGRLGANFGHLGALGGASTPLPSLYLGQVATKSRIANGISSANKQLMSRSHHVARDTIASVQIGLPAWEWGSSFSSTIETPAGGNITYTASVEYPAGTFTQILFSGSASGVATNNTTLTSDATAVAIPNGADFWVRVHATAAVAIVFVGSQVSTPISPQCDVSNGEAMTFAASGVADQTLGGTVVATQAGTTGPIFSPVFIVSMTRKPSVMLLGDSRHWGAGDSFDSSGNLGEAERSLAPSFGVINAGSFGDSTAAYIGSHTNRAALAQYVSHIVFELGINDISGGSLTASATLANRQTIIGFFPGKTIFGQTITTVSTSSDSWATLANQTLNPNSAQIISFNTSIRAGEANTAGFFEIANVNESAQNSGKWVVNGTAFYHTIDGTHENQAGYLAIQAAGAINTSLIHR